MLANDSILVTPGTGATVATHLLGGKEHQAFVEVDEYGHVGYTAPTYSWWLPSSAVSSLKMYGYLYNAAGSGKIVQVRGVWAIPKSDVAVTGIVGVEVTLLRATGAGTGGTVHTYNAGSTQADHVINPFDTTNAALPAQVTGRAVPTSGMTITTFFWTQYIFTEETNAASYIGAYTNLLPVGTRHQTITMNEGQGFVIRQGSAAGVGSLGFLVVFTLV